MKYRHGFTIIEVSLFLALSAFLMVGIIFGTNASMARQRYNDSANDFAEFLRGVYSDVSNVSNDNPNSSNAGNAGRTAYANYGKLVTFGEDGEENTIHSYDIIGRAVSISTISGSSSVLEILNIVKANVVEKTKDSVTGATVYSAYRDKSYQIPWDAWLKKHNNSDNEVSPNAFKGALLVVRSPLSGNMHTFFAEAPVDQDGNSLLKLQSYLKAGESRSLSVFSEKVIKSGIFEEVQVDMCLDSDDNSSSNRRDVRIQQFSATSSGVFLVGLDDKEDSLCLGK